MHAYTPVYAVTLLKKCPEDLAWIWYIFDNIIKEADYVLKLLEEWKKPRIPSALHSYQSLFYFFKYLGRDFIGTAVYFWMRNTGEAEQTINFWKMVCKIFNRVQDSNSQLKLKLINSLRGAIRHMAKTVIYTGVNMCESIIKPGLVLLTFMKEIYDKNKKTNKLSKVDFMDGKKIKKYSDEFFQAIRQFASRFLPFTVWKGLCIPFLLAYFGGKTGSKTFFGPKWSKR